MSAGGILALDLGLVTGFAYGLPGSVPIFGCVRLPGPAAGFGRRFCHLTNGICDLIVEHRPALLAKEAILRLAAQNSAHVARLQFGYQAIADEEAHRQDVEVVEEDVDLVRNHLIGRRRAPKGTEVKDWVIGWLRRRGFDVTQPDQADAIMIWLWACEVHGNKLRRPRAA